MDAIRRRRFTALLLLAIMASIVSACGAATTASPTPAPDPTAAPTVTPSDPAAALRIADPWVLDDEFPEVRQQILDGVLADDGFRAAEVRHVTGPDGESAFLLAADGGLAADTDLDAWARRLSTTTLTGAALGSIDDREVALLQTDDVSMVAWLEPPLLVAVYGADPETARRIATAVLDAP